MEFLRVTDLHAFYGDSHILHGIDFKVDRGEVVILLGRNGAGRTTTLKAILGLVGARSGSVTIDGREAIGLPPHKIARLGVGYCPEERGIYSSLTTDENLVLPPQVAPGGMSIDDIFAMFPNLEGRRDTQGTRLSGGATPLVTHCSSATISARSAGPELCGLRGLAQGPGAVVLPACPPCCVPAIR